MATEGDASAQLSRRERQIMDILYEKQKATALEIMEAMPDAPGYSSVRKFMMILESKGFVKHEKQGKQHVFVPTLAPGNAAQSALSRVLKVFYGGSLESAVSSMLSSSEADVSEEELARLEQIVRDARRNSEA
jgi:BlaI family penicillinase repressor